MSGHRLTRRAASGALLGAAAGLTPRFARADAIRAELLAKGILLEDGAGGTTWRKA